ncbi:MAG TPA: circadian clock KaiB family protein [Sandaracinaceae bacterium LLY-WYZ-13_1]|nr:circadian clock KaiB family protein [Sandaracinaceae bacterium LLY-WYZ-13_1]
MRPRLRLYVAAGSPRSRAARRALEDALGACRLEALVEVVDVFAAPEKAMEDRILVTPTLLTVEGPRRALIGDLSDRGALDALLRAVMQEDA